MNPYIISIISTAFICVAFFVPALIKKKKYERGELEEIQRQWLEAKDNVYILGKEEAILTDKKNQAQLQLNLATQTLSLLENKISTQELEIHRLEKSIQLLTSTETSIKENMEKAIEERSEALSKEYREAELAHAKEYELIMIDAVKDFNEEWNKHSSELYDIKQQIKEKQQIYQAILDDEHRRNQEKAERDFYRLNIPEEDLSEVEKIREITPYFRNPEVLGKAVWTAYFQKPYQDLIARQFKSNKPTGIYKITCLPNTKVYVGQSVNVPNRFSEHIKRGLGAETTTRNRLYTEMKKWGVENFTFELLEEVPREKLGERERFWIQYFNSADAEVGMNGNKGVKE